MTARLVRFLVPIALVVGSAPRSAVGAQGTAAPDRARPVASAPADSALDAATRALSSQLRCPVCQGLSVQDSPAELAQQMRDLVRQQLEQGKDPEQVKAYFVARYGQWILMAPPAAGFNWLVYTLPGAVLLFGALLVAMLVRRWTASPRDDTMHAPPNASPPMH